MDVNVTNKLCVFLTLIAVSRFSILVSAQGTVCSTDVCKNTAAAILSSVDLSAQPCDNFYQFACGNFMRNTHLPAGRLTVGPFTDAAVNQQQALKDAFETAEAKLADGAQSKATNVYKACKRSVSTLAERSANMDFLKEMLNDFLKGWPLTTRGWNASTFDLGTSLAKISSRLHQGFFLSPKVLPDLNNSTKHTLTLLTEAPFQATSVYLEQVIKTSDEWEQELRSGEHRSNEYQESPLTGMIREVVCIVDPNCRTNPSFYSDVETLHNILTDGGYSLNSKALFPPETINIVKNFYYQSKQSEVYKKLGVTELNQLFPLVNWQNYFKILFQNTGFDVTRNFQIIVLMEPVRNLLQAFGQASPRELALYFGWHIVSLWGPVFSPQIRSILSPTLDQSDMCLQVVSGGMGYAVARMYNDDRISNSTVKEATNLVQNLKTAFQGMLKENTWMDNSTKTLATRKINNMLSSVSAPEWIKNDEKLNAYYSKVATNDTTDFRVAFKKIRLQFFQNQVARLSQPVDKLNTWPIETPAMTNAFYFVPGNSMYFASGMLQYPFFQSGRPNAVNYGSLGYIAGHEITHGFDNNGRAMNENGEFENWWTESSARSFMARADCMTQQYGSIIEPMTGMNIDGMLTLGENIADNGGIRAAFRAHKSLNGTVGGRLVGLERFSEDQLFFLSAAHMYCTQSSIQFLLFQLQRDAHSPNMFRAIVPFQNSEDFSKAFNCPRNSFMNPSSKCQVW